MDLRKLKTVLELFEGAPTVAELEVRDGESHVRLSKSTAASQQPAVAPPPVIYTTPPSESSTAETAEKEPSDIVRGTEVVSPMVGTFYRASSPEIPPFVRVGQVVEVGQTLCIIEAMKLMNEIPSTVSGRVTEIFLENNAPVAYGDKLFLIE
ncbi:MAG: acetyl-CoA carboxylase biotin carboxyl carrier protein [Gammaproteobacteria bacterium WSBS_2016_MAG_OTU1]